jgi:long-chain acyl-CoA synthetase
MPAASSLQAPQSDAFTDERRMSEMPWLKSYPEGVRWDVTFTPTGIQHLLDDTAATWPDNPALGFMGRTTNYAELLHQANCAAKGLQQLGVGPGVHVGLYLPNTPHYVIAFFAVLKAGGTVVNYSPLDAAEVLKHKIEDSLTDIVITLDLRALYPQMAGMLGKTRLRKLVVGSMAEYSASPESVSAQMKAGKVTVDVPDDERHISFAALLDNDGDHVEHPLTNPAEALAVLQYTGGTTGHPKGAMLTHGNLTAACAQYFETAGGTPPVFVEGEERSLAILPPFHIYALTVNILLGIRGAAQLFLHTRFDPEAVLKEIETEKITTFAGVPTMFTALLAHADVAKYDLRSLKFCGSGGAPLPLELAQRFTQVAGCPVLEGWGMTETSPTGTFTPIRGLQKAGSCGMPMPGIMIRMLDLEDQSRYVPIGERGELCISGPNVMKGYWNNHEATAAVTTFDGMLRTGDVATMDGDGFVYIVDRTKDMLLCSGFNVYPRTLEEAIYQHPSVKEVVVIGIHDDYRGQTPKAFVSLKPDAETFTLEELQVFLKDKLGKHEMVQALELRSELPKTAVGKLSKKELYDEERKKREASDDEQRRS